MSEPLYRKVVKGKAVRYEPYAEAPLPKLTEVDSERIFTIMAGMLISFQETIIEQLPPHSRKCREVVKSSEAIKALAGHHYTPLFDTDVTIGVKVWRAAVAELQLQLSGGVA